MPYWLYRSQPNTIFLILFWTVMGNSSTVYGEPWFGSRFAQNCASCHAPGRLNLPAAERRCTLSCQGCHVNPSGGGVRSEYGKWTGTRWLRSYMKESLGHKAGPAPYEQQEYARQRDRASSLQQQPASNAAKKAASSGSKDMRAAVSELVTSKLAHQESAAFDQHQSPGQDALNQADFLQQIPFEDPYRQRRRQSVVGGADIRFQYYKPLEPVEQKGRFFAMTGDFGLAIRPLPEKLQIVYESRFLGQISGPPLDEQIDQAHTRSLFVLVDDLPWNSYAMGGYYMPLFANDSPDHTKLSRRFLAASLTGNSRGAYRLLYKTFSVGAAPNVPYLNLHHIAKRIDPSEPDDQTTGFVMNSGLRFVSLGASLQYSLWSTRDSSQDLRDTRVLMQAVYLSSTLGQDRLYLGWESVLSEVERNRDFYRAWVTTAEARFRFYREFYLTSEWSVANSDENLAPGSARQQKYGVQAFLWSGFSWHSAYVIDDFRSDSRDRQSQHYLTSQLHIYY